MVIQATERDTEGKLAFLVHNIAAVIGGKRSDEPASIEMVNGHVIEVAESFSTIKNRIIRSFKEE